MLPEALEVGSSCKQGKLQLKWLDLAALQSHSPARLSFNSTTVGFSPVSVQVRCSALHQFVLALP